jgi:hypothetical protein
MSHPARSALRLATDASPARAPSVEELILEAVRAIRYGSVEITIHDSRVVQIERTEKLRVNGGG